MRTAEIASDAFHEMIFGRLILACEHFSAVGQLPLDDLREQFRFRAKMTIEGAPREPDGTHQGIDSR